MEAMAARRAQSRFARVWQIPLLAASLGLFGYATYLFIDPKPAPTFAQRIEAVEAIYKAGDYEPALAQSNKLIAANRIKPADEARLHLLIAAIIDAVQKEQHLSVARNYQQIIEQSRDGLALGAKPTAEIYQRVGQSLEKLEKPLEAIAAYRRAIDLDRPGTLPLLRKVIELQLAQDDPAPADASIAEYLKAPKLSKVDRAWALGKQAQSLAGHGKYADAAKVLNEAVKLDPQSNSQGVLHYWLGYSHWKLGETAEAERLLRVARDQLTVEHPLDAEAAFLLGEIRRVDNDPKGAISFYETVIVSHPESRPAPLARLERGVCRIQLDNAPAGLSDLHEVVKFMATHKVRQAEKTEAVAGLKDASKALRAKGDFQGAMEAMEDEQEMVPDPPAEFYSRLGKVLESCADQIEQAPAADASAADKSHAQEQVRKVRAEAGDAYIALSRALTLADDRGQGDALWKGVDLYDRAGATQQAITAMETFVAERPSDGKTPDVLLRLGRAYQATGQFDLAIKQFLHNQFRYPQSLAATRSGVPLAQAYIAKGPTFYPKAEKVLLAVLENNPILTPESEEFRHALFELAQLYYRTNRYEEAISRLEETTARYPNDPRMGQLLFLMADSYRKSAWLLNAEIKTPVAPAVGADGKPLTPVEQIAATSARAEAAAARHDRLLKAKALFDRVVDLSRTAPPKDDLERLYLKLSHFYRADCLYDLGQYEEAIRLYDTATLRYQDDPTSVSAYVQIVNAWCALGRLDEARTAAERAKWLLRRMPAATFEAGKSSMPKEYWENWLRWTSESGMYAKDLNKPADNNVR
jgi:tetratricopeptide (TPR) repeat protein